MFRSFDNYCSLSSMDVRVNLFSSDEGMHVSHTLGARTLVKALKIGALLINGRDPPSAAVGSTSFPLSPRGRSHDGVRELLQGCSGRLLFHIGNLTLTAEIISTGECKQLQRFIKTAGTLVNGRQCDTPLS